MAQFQPKGDTVNDQDRFDAANQNAELVTRIANAVAHRDHRRTNLNGGNEGDDMTPLERMRFGMNGHPKSARYDGDATESGPRAERCKCGHTDKRHNDDDDECRSCPCIEFRLDASPLCCCGHGQTQHAPGPHLATRCQRPLCRCLHYEPDGVRGLNSDPTGLAGIKHDGASQDLKDHDADTKALAVIAERIAVRLAKYGPARVASDADRALLAKANVVPEPGCSNCGKHGHWQPIDPRVPKRAICGFCLSWERDTSAMPGKRECDLHADGKTVRRPDKNHLARKASA